MVVRTVAGTSIAVLAVAETDVSLDEACAVLDSADGPRLSELIIEMRGPKA